MRWAASTEGGRLGGPLLVALAACLASGCADRNAEFLIANRPMVESDGGTLYTVHLGDKPSLAFRTKFWACDYAILHDEAADVYDDCGPNLDGEFVWPYAFTRPTGPDGPTRLTVTGYRQAGSRDHMAVRGRLEEAESTGEPADALVARASLLVTVEQHVVDIVVPLSIGEPDWPLSRLVITGDDGRRTRIRHCGGTTRRGCFTHEGPDEAGAFRVRYTPKIEEINPSGPTKVELLVADAKGRTKTFTQLLGKP